MRIFNACGHPDIEDLGNPSVELLYAVLRHDLYAFSLKAFEVIFPGTTFNRNWHHKVVAYVLEQTLKPEPSRLIVNLPPRSLKSFYASVVLPAFYLGHFPSRTVVCVSYSAELADKMARDCRALMESPFYKELFPDTRIDRSRRIGHDFMTTQRGGRLATSIGGTLTGRGGDLIIIDDPSKPADANSATMRQHVIDWAGGTLPSRINDKRHGSIVLVMQRLHDDDLTGHFLRQGGWRLVSMPAIATKTELFLMGENCLVRRDPGELLHPAFETPEVLENLKHDMGNAAFAAQYQQDPLPPDSPHVKWTWFQVYEQAPCPDHATEVWQSWDTAIKDGELNDYSVGITIMVKDGKYYILDVCRRKMDYPSLKQLIEQKAREYPGPRVLIEDKGSGSSLIQDLKRNRIVSPVAFVPEGDKVSRFVCQTAVIERGDVFIPADAPWIGDFRREVLQFPHGQNDDQVDALSQFLVHMQNRKRNKAYVADLNDVLFGRRSPRRR